MLLEDVVKGLMLLSAQKHTVFFLNILGSVRVKFRGHLKDACWPPGVLKFQFAFLRTETALPPAVGLDRSFPLDAFCNGSY